MAVISYPRVIPSELSVQLQTSVSRMRSPYAPNATQLISRGVAWWVGTLTWGRNVWDRDLNMAGQIDEITGFLDACEGGLHSFDIPLAPLLKGRDLRYPMKDESDDGSSVHVTAIAPATSSATQVGLAATLTLDELATGQTGLRKGDWIHLTDATGQQHRGAYRVIQHHAANDVVVAPAPPQLDMGANEQHRVITREPTLRARLSAPPPSITYRGEWFQPVTVQWEQSQEAVL